MDDGWSLGDYPAEDLFEMAATVEQGGFDFYARLIARTSDPEVMRELKDLRDEEARHKSFFLQLLRDRGLTPKGPVSPGLKAILDREFIQPTVRAYATGTASDRNRVLEFAVGLEEKSIAFYKALQSSCTGPGQHDEISRIMADEKKHKSKLVDLLAHQSAKDGSWSLP